MPDCTITYAPDRGMLTGLMRMGETPWDQPDTWWLDCLATWRIDPPTRFGCRRLDPRTSRTEGCLLPVRIEPGGGVDVLQEAGRILSRLGAVEAIVCHIRRPLAAGEIMAIQEINARLVAGIRARQKIEAGDSRPRGKTEGRMPTAREGGTPSPRTKAAAKPRDEEWAFS
jgi:hypothetical protein